jgi:hypothetical protein
MYGNHQTIEAADAHEPREGEEIEAYTDEAWEFADDEDDEDLGEHKEDNDEESHMSE